MFVSDEATLDVSFDVALARLTALAGNGVLTRVSAIGGFLSRIAETIARAGAAAG